MDNGIMPGSMQEAMRQEQMRRKRRRIVSVTMAWLLAILILAAVIFCTVTLIMAAGGRSLRQETGNNGPDLMLGEMTGSEFSADSSQKDSNDSNGTSDNGNADAVANEDNHNSTSQTTVWKEGWIRYNDKVYEYNTDVMTFLVMGIDQMNSVKESTTTTGGGQSDANFLVVVNPDRQDISLVALNRDTMTEIEMYGMGEDGNSITTVAQLATQHGFGDGKELSCALVKKAVSKLFYNLPIHGYIAVNMGAIAEINDCVGGVEVTALEDVLKANVKKGDTVTLKGMDAFWYVKYRDTTVFESNVNRLARQKQYLKAFSVKLKDAIQNDITLPMTMYQSLSKYMVTDISTQEVTYLVGELLNYQVNSDTIYSLEGETIMGEKFEEFYPDKEALRELMIQLFYREVEGVR